MTQTIVRRGGNFKPQVRQVRADGWTDERRRIFFANLCATCNVVLAAAAAGMNRRSAYAQRRADPVFRERWRRAIADGYVRIETMLIARAGGTADAAALMREVDAQAAGDAGALLEVTEELDSVLALQLIANHRKALHGGGRRCGGPRPTAIPADELADVLMKHLSALNKRRGGKG